MTTEARVLLIGDCSRDEFCAPVATLRDRANLAAVPQIEAALDYLRNRAEPELIVLAQRWPGEFSAFDVDRLQRAAPLARICGLLGSWCEGESRSGRPWPAVTRAYWHEWPARFGQQIGERTRGACPAWGLPVTARDEERLLAAAEAPLTPRAGLVAIRVASASLAAALSDACRLRGYATVSLRPVNETGAAPRDGLPSPPRSVGPTISGATVMLWDTIAEDACNAAVVQDLRRSVGDTPILALLDFPRSSDRTAAMAAGVTEIISKPFLLDDLYWQIDRAACGLSD